MTLARCEAAEPDPWRADVLDRLAGRRVLLVQPNALTRRVLRRQLEAWGAEVVEARDSTGALAALTEPGRFHLGMVRHSLPRNGGREVAKMLRDHDHGADMRILLMSNSSKHVLGPTPAGHAFAESAVAPFGSAVLFAKLGGLLGIDVQGANAAPSASVRPAVLGGDRPLRVLVAEDNPLNQKVLGAMLARVGAAVDIVADGLNAVEAVRGTAYDAVLMDILMPRLDGIGAADRIRRLGGAAATVPIIAVTANAIKGDRERYLSAGMNDYVSKPIDAAELAAALSRQCGRLLDLTGVEPSPACAAPDADDGEARLAAFVDDLERIVAA